MQGLNEVRLIGRLGQDPELKHGGESGTAYCRMSLACTKIWAD